MTDVRGRTSITPSSKRKKNVLMCFVTCCASGKTFRVRKRGKVSGVGAHPPYSWTYRPDGCESSFSFDLRLTLTVFSSSVFHLFLLIYLFFIRFREITKFLKQPFKTSSLRTMQKKTKHFFSCESLQKVAGGGEMKTFKKGTPKKLQFNQ